MLWDKWSLSSAPVTLALNAQQSDTELVNITMQGIDQDQIRIGMYCAVGGEIGRDREQEVSWKTIKENC